MFQSLSGFPLSCDPRPGDEGANCCQVSIPIGFSIELRPRGRRFSIDVGEFQSLSGFPLSCDDAGNLYGSAGIVVSIPIGFSIELRQAWRDPNIRPIADVSIPIGFSIELRQGTGSLGRCRRRGFNPYRVFH